ncbi:MAG: proton-conducting transporter membrane subunit [Chloroflexota bacterium]
MIELLVLATIGLPVLAGCAAWFSAAGRARQVSLSALWVAVGTGSVLAGLVFAGRPARAFDGLIVVDALGAYVLVLVLAVAAIAGAGSPSHLRTAVADGTLRPHDAGRYYALFLWFAAGLAAIPLLDNLGLVWVGIEATTIVSALLVGFARTPAAIEAAWKYLILGSIGIGFALLGTLLVYASSVGVLGASSDALAWTRLVEIAPRLDPGLARLGFLFVLAGYGTKAGLVPFHTWLPDAHSQAPSPISALLSGAALAVALYALARFHLVTTGALGPEFSSTLLVVFGLASLAVALPFIVAQGDLKRLLAYSSIEHLGLATLALGFGGHLALLGLSVHLASHGLAKATAFLAAGRLVAERRSRRIGRLGGALVRSPADGRALAVGALVLAGLPPSGIFVGELAILIGGFQAGWGLAATAAAAILALAVAGLLFHVVRIAVAPAGRPDPERAPDAEARPDAVAPPHGIGLRAIVLGLPLTVVVVAGLWTPAPIAAALEQVVRILGGGHG